MRDCSVWHCSQQIPYMMNALQYLPVFAAILPNVIYGAAELFDVSAHLCFMFPILGNVLVSYAHTSAIHHTQVAFERPQIIHVASECQICVLL